MNVLQYSVFTPLYGLARSFMAFGLLSTLLFTHPKELFVLDGAMLFSNKNWNFFYILGYDNLYLAYFGAIIVLFLVISGFFTKFTSILHFWVVLSFAKGAAIVEGGDQLAAILSLLILPIAILDKRKNHWFNHEQNQYNVFSEYFAFSCIVICKLQMSVVYFDAAIQKMKVKEWIDGTAVYYWFNDSTFGAVGIWHYLFNFLFTSPITTPLIAWSVILFELVLGCGLFMSEKFKPKLFVLAVLFHLFIIFIHGLFSFFFSMLAGLILYLLPLNFQLTNFSTKIQWKKYLQTK
jgi:antimicrobial peptide system SdpB family protein